MSGSSSRWLLAFLGFAVLGCDPPECIDGPPNLAPSEIAECVPPPEGAVVEEQVASAGAELRDDGTLVLTWSSLGIECGVEASDVELPEDCAMTGWTLTAEIPAELATPGVIELAEHPEVRGVMTVTHEFDGGSRGSFGDEPFFVGQLEITAVNEACVTGVLHGFGTGDPDPTLGGPELDGAFLAPRC